jgi:hypothetical protein
MTTIAQNIKKTTAKFYLSLLFIPGLAALCQAQGVAGADQISGLDVPGSAPIQSSAPALNAWEPSYGAEMEMSIGASDEMVCVPATSFFAAPVTPVTTTTFSPAISPEPSTLGLLLAGSAALIRSGWRKRSN